MEGMIAMGIRWVRVRVAVMEGKIVIMLIKLERQAVVMKVVILL